MKRGAADFGLLLVYPSVHELEYLGLVSPNCLLKCPNYSKGVSAKNLCHTLQILAVKELGALSESIKKENL